MHVLSVLVQALTQTYRSFLTYLPFLVAGILLASGIRVYLDQKKLSSFLRRFAGSSIFLVTIFATVTPFCSCGTMAVVLSMLASTVPWGPVVAFMVSSPLMSPSEYVYAAGVMGWGFANALLISSVLLGVGAGYGAQFLEKRGFLKNQARRRNSLVSPLPAGQPVPRSGASACCTATVADPGMTLALTLDAGVCTCGTISSDAWHRLGAGLARLADRMRLRKLAAALRPMAVRIFGLYLAFSLLGHVVTAILPSEWLLTLFGRGRLLAVPLAATAGLPLYINAEVSMPLIRSFMTAGMSPGAALALIITGAGTSVGAISGAFIIARRRVVGLIVASLWIGAVVAGSLYNVVVG